jgi:hypothetical protein
MATPRTLRLPLGVDTYGGALLTATTDQGRECTEQLVRTEVFPPGYCANPWLASVGLTEEVVFSDPQRARVDITAQVKAKFARLEKQERARLLPETLDFRRDPRVQGRYVLSFQWEDLRRNVLRQSTLGLRAGGSA